MWQFIKKKYKYRGNSCILYVIKIIDIYYGRGTTFRVLMKGIYTMNRCTKEYNKLREELAGLENKHSEV